MRNNGSNFEVANIPDDDVVGWMITLREGGLTETEIESFMLEHNKTYYEQKYPRQIRIEEELRRIEEYIMAKTHRSLSEEQRRHLRKTIASREEFRI